MEKDCKTGTAVLEVAECKKACGYLGISSLGVFKEGRPCYKGGSGVCNQNVKKPSSRAMRICKGIQIQMQSKYIIWIFLLKHIMTCCDNKFSTKTDCMYFMESKS